MKYPCGKIVQSYFHLLSAVKRAPQANLLEQILHKKRKEVFNMENNVLTESNILTTASDQVTPLALGHQSDGSYILECRWCHRIEVLSSEEVQWYLDRGYVMPTRCAPCRRKRRGIAKHYAAQQGNV